MTNTQGPNSGWCQHGTFVKHNAKRRNSCKQRALPDKVYCPVHHQLAMERVANMKKS